MEVAIFSDVHGNLPALEIFLDKTKHIDLKVCLGDVVNYGPWSNECVDRLISVPNLISLRGNHEDDFLNGNSTSKHKIAKAFYEFCFPKFNRIPLIKQYQHSYVNWNWEFKHTIDGLNVFPDSDVSIEQATMIGHTHRSFIKVVEGNLLVNVGSIGQNREYINVIEYVILNTEHMSVKPVQIKYDVSPVINKMKEIGYPEICMKYFQSKPLA